MIKMIEHWRPKWFNNTADAYVERIIKKTRKETFEEIWRLAYTSLMDNKNLKDFMAEMKKFRKRNT